MTKERECVKKLSDFLNAMMGSFIGVFIGHACFRVWDYQTNPGLYALQSAPWYTSILLYGVVTAVLLLVCISIKAVIKYKQKKEE